MGRAECGANGQELGPGEERSAAEMWLAEHRRPATEGEAYRPAVMLYFVSLPLSSFVDQLSPGL
jgi:hypothetical protein